MVRTKGVIRRCKRQILILSLCLVGDTIGGPLGKGVGDTTGS